MPKLWTETIEEHRRAVRDAILDTTAALVTEQGVASVTMSQIAERTGIGRATLYKYFPDVESILVAWHERQVSEHLQLLAEVKDRPGDPGERLEAVMLTYARITRERHGTDLAALLHPLVHRGAHVDQATQRLHDFISELVAEGAEAGDLRDDVAPTELASFCLHALTAAAGLPTDEAVHRLVATILTGLRPVQRP